MKKTIIILLLALSHILCILLGYYFASKFLSNYDKSVEVLDNKSEVYEKTSTTNTEATEVAGKEYSMPENERNLENKKDENNMSTNIAESTGPKSEDLPNITEPQKPPLTITPPVEIPEETESPPIQPSEGNSTSWG